MLAYESIINVFEDAVNGSYYIEDITKQFAEKSWALFVEIEEAGGYLELLKQGVVQKRSMIMLLKSSNGLKKEK